MKKLLCFALLILVGCDLEVQEPRTKEEIIEDFKELLNQGTPDIIPTKSIQYGGDWIAYPICEEENQLYPKCFERFSCADFNWTIFLSRYTHSVYYCSRIGEEAPCHISMVKDMLINKEYCGFERGDIIWILENVIIVGDKE